MPKLDLAPVGAPCWVQVTTSDVDGARAFYTALFGWEAEDPQPSLGGYFNFRHDGVRVAGCMANQEGGPDNWSIYLLTDDAEKTVASAEAAGAQVIVPAVAVEDLGSMAFFIDPSGAAIGAWQPGAHKGFGAIAEPGAPSWWELHTRDYQGALAFYRDVFRWETHAMEDTEEFRYTTLVNPHGEGYLAGVMDAAAFLPEGVPSQWSVYFGVADADAALAKAVELGGSIVQPAEDTPYGRLATAADPTGAVFKIVAPNEAMPAQS